MLQFYTMLFLTCYMAFYTCVALLPILLPVLTIAHTISIELILILSNYVYNLTYNSNIILPIPNLINLYPTPVSKKLLTSLNIPITADRITTQAIS